MNRNKKQDRLTSDMWEVVESGCWMWRGTPNSGGYCHVMLRGVRHKAHRATFTEFRGRVPEGMQLDHLCRNRTCVNPDHLEPVTQTVNVRRGLRAKLTIEAAREIRASRREGGAALAMRFGVSKATIHKVLAGTAWREEQDAVWQTYADAVTV